MNKTPYKFCGTLRRWRIPWIIGIVIMTLSAYSHRALYHLYVYFFIAGILTLPIEWSGWGKIDENGLLVRYGIFNLYKIVINWSEIEKIYTEVETHHFLRIGYGAIRDDKGYQTKSIAIKFLAAVPDSIKESVSCFRINMLFGQNIYLKGPGVLILDEALDCGFSNFYKMISPFVMIEDREIGDTQNIGTKGAKNNLNLCDAILFVIPVIIYIFM